MKIYTINHRMVKNKGFCICRMDSFDVMGPELASLWQSWCRVKDNIPNSANLYVLAICISDNRIYPIYVAGDICSVVEEGKQYICGVRKSHEIVPLMPAKPQTIEFCEAVKGGKVEIMSTEDAELIEATEELNNLDTEVEKEKELKEDQIAKCHKCTHYISGYDVCGKIVGRISDVKACTAYEYRRGC